MLKKFATSAKEADISQLCKIPNTKAPDRDFIIQINSNKDLT